MATRHCANCNARLLPSTTRCPWCGALVSAGPAPQVERAQPEAARSAVGKVCPYCQTAIAAGDTTVVCSACGTPHHADCWRENGRCTTFGCQGGPGGQLAPTSTAPVRVDVPAGPYAPPSSPYGYEHLPSKAHRGGTILFCGILSLVFCLGYFGIIFGIAAWVMGSQDLAAMDSGVMDPSGRSLTETGRALGIAGTLFAGLLILIRLANAFTGSAAG